MHTILYIMRSVHIDGRIFVNDKKIGVTGKGNATLKSRISQLSSTKSNFGVQCIAAWEVPESSKETALYYEGKLHKKLKEQMVPCAQGIKTEWFYDDGGEQFDIIQEVSNAVDEWGLLPIDVSKLQDANTQALANKATKGSFNQIFSLVKTFSSSDFISYALTKDCIRITTSDKRSFHINVRADLNKQYISISKTKHDYDSFIKLCIEN
ncbi:MAG: hypothetical protein ACRC6F_05015, partial [Aeromonas sp.]